MRILLKILQGLHELRKFENLCPRGLPNEHTASQICCKSACFKLSIHASFTFHVIMYLLTAFTHSVGSY